jgi:nucleoid-associated protein YgaU
LEVEMSIRRLIATAAAMGGIAVVLGVLTPAFPAMVEAVAGAQRTVDTQGTDMLVASAAGLLAWAVWVWGALGLVLTAASAVPGATGGAARALLHVALPAGARRSAALLLGIGLGISAPLAGAALPALAPSASAATAVQDVPDWPASAQTGTPVPDWPAPAPAPTAAAPSAAAPAGDRVVVRGDCLWHIAADSLLGLLGRPPDDAEVATAVDAWWHANADVIGPDPDLLLPGQVLRAPGPP